VHGSSEENVDHLFISCVLAMTFWSKVSSWCNIRPIFAFFFNDLMEICYLLIRGDVDFKKAVHAVIMKVVYEVMASASLILLKGRSRMKATTTLIIFLFEPG